MKNTRARPFSLLITLICVLGLLLLNTYGMIHLPHYQAHHCADGCHECAVVRIMLSMSSDAPKVVVLMCALLICITIIRLFAPRHVQDMSLVGLCVRMDD